jgi:hypothetical protein
MSQQTTNSVPDNTNWQKAGADIAGKISTKMRDSLRLSDSTTAQLYQLTLPFHAQKMAIVRQYRGSLLMAGLLQKLEYTRDSLYATLLTVQQYQRYKTQKRWFVLNN